jgi:S-adenosyl methyltransferase
MPEPSRRDGRWVTAPVMRSITAKTTMRISSSCPIAGVRSPWTRCSIGWSLRRERSRPAVAHFIPDTAALRAAFDRYRDVAVSGSYLALSHGNMAASPGAAPKMGELYGRAGTRLVTHSRSEIIRMVDGWNIVEPGVVPTWQWRPRPSGFASDDADPFTLALVACKP